MCVWSVEYSNCVLQKMLCLVWSCLVVKCVQWNQPVKTLAQDVRGSRRSDTLQIGWTTGIGPGSRNNAADREYNIFITKLWQLNRPNLRQINFAAPRNTSCLSVRLRADHELNVPGNPADISCGSLSNSALTSSLNFLLFGYDIFYSPP
jgi:hypothetical protein